MHPAFLPYAKHLDPGCEKPPNGGYAPGIDAMVPCTVLLIILLYTFELHLNGSQPLIYTCDVTAPCGCSSKPVILSSSSRIIGGENSQIGSWGWIVSLQSDDEHFCGGSIISPSHILTAAHCINYFEALGTVTVHAGIHNKTAGGQIRTIAVVLIHPDYNHFSLENDIAILHLSVPLDMTDPLVTQ
ncbi:unnamed protein product, partial [Didymodactylos carnosus]